MSMKDMFVHPFLAHLSLPDYCWIPNGHSQ
jgi:hypothetical protein